MDNNLLNSLNNINDCLERIINSCQNSYIQQSTTTPPATAFNTTNTQKNIQDSKSNDDDELLNKETNKIKFKNKISPNEIQLNSIKNLRRIDNLTLSSKQQQQLKTSTCLNPTIEELFHNLDLIYDDSARELDELERKLREYVHIQKLILQEISIDSLLVSFKTRNLNKKHQQEKEHNKQKKQQHKLKQEKNLKKYPNRVKKTKISLKIYIKFDRSTKSTQGPYFKGFKSNKCLVFNIKYLPELLKFCTKSTIKKHKKNIKRNNFEHLYLFKRPRSKTHEAISLNPKEQTIIYTSSIEMKQYELELIEACKWLSKTGFVGIVEMFKNNEFPLSNTKLISILNGIPLNTDDMKSLIKRLEILNKSAELKIDYYRLSKLHQQQQQQEIQLQLLNNQDDEDNSSTDDQSTLKMTTITPTSKPNIPIQRYHSFQAYGVKSYLHHKINLNNTSLSIEINDNKFSPKGISSSGSDGYNSSTSSTPTDKSKCFNATSIYDNIKQYHSPSSVSSFSESRMPRLGDESQDSGYGNSPPMRKLKPQYSFNTKSFKNVRYHLSGLNVKQFHSLKTYSLLKVTSLIEKYSNGVGVSLVDKSTNSGWKGFRNRLIKKNRHSLTLDDLKHKQVFGVPFKINIQRIGQPLPQPIIQIMKFLRANAHRSVGIFRKNGSKSRMNIIRESIEKGSFQDPNLMHFGADIDTYIIDLADVLKQYFRELPECLLTNKLSQTLIDIFTYLPSYNEKFKALQYCLFLLDDENRSVLKHLIYLLHDIAACNEITKMDTRNIAICLAPSLISMTNVGINQLSSPSTNLISKAPQTLMTSSYTQGVTNHTNNINNQCNAALDCLAFMIEQPARVFEIPNEALEEIKSCEYPQPSGLLSLTKTKIDLNIHINEKFDEILKELKSKSWLSIRSTDEVDVSYKVPNDDCPLRVWKLSIEIEANAKDIINLLLNRSKWDDDLKELREIRQIDTQIDIVQYSLNFLPPQATRDFCELRAYKQGNKLQNTKYNYLIYGASVERENGLPLLGDIPAVILKNSYAIEQLDTYKCKLINIYRADYKGYSPEWYNRIQPLLLKRNMSKIKRVLVNRSYETKV